MSDYQRPCYRKSFEVIGYADDGEMYCLDCFSGDTDEAAPVFLGSEYDTENGETCGNCLQYLDGHEPEELEESDDDED